MSAATTVDDSGPIHAYDGRLESGPESVCIYALAPAHAADDDAVAAFTRAAHRWAGISHNPYVATVYESGENPLPWVAFDAGDRFLADVVPDLSHDERLLVLDSAFEGLNTGSLYNVSHTGLEPGAVVISDEEEGPVGELTDWGLERSVSAALGERSITPCTAPEQLDGGTAPTTEVYRAGMLAYWLSTGCEPFADAVDTETAIRAGELRPATEVADLPGRIDEVIEMATATDPADRYESARMLRSAIRSVLS